MRNRILRKRIRGFYGSAFALLLAGGATTSCSDDLPTGTPSWLGESIYAELESRGNFTETLKLINAQSEDYASVLKRTGSKTLFAATDEAWATFYARNSWGATSLDQLTEAQKKLLFKSNMINSAYLVELLGNIPSATADSDPIEGSAMRRASSVDVMDSVPLVPADQFPVLNPARVGTTGQQIDHWGRLRGKQQALILQDDGAATMIHFMPKFMQSNNITSEDVAFLTNGKITSNEAAFVNGHVITERDITCQNGYIHVVDGVDTPLDNLANVIASQPQFSIYKRLLDRFSYPSYSAGQTAEYRRQYGGEDSVFVRRYFNSHGSHSFTAYDSDNGSTAVTTQLPYDPGWNLYRLYSASGTTFQYDAAAMLVPTDEALTTYLRNEGADLNERYAQAGPGPTAWDNAPDEVVLPLLQNTMLTSLKSAIPSQFASINNTAAEPMGVEKKDIDQVLWASNGVVYQTNKVYVAPEYVSVFYPAVIRANDDLNLVYTVVNNDNKVVGGEGFYAYLNNMGSDYSFIIPTDEALQTYYDPVSRFRTRTNGASTAVAYKFFVDGNGNIAATAPLVDWTSPDSQGRGQIGTTLFTPTPSVGANGASSGDVFNHFKDILNSSLALSLFTPGQKFYRAKNGGPVVVEWSGNRVVGVAGSFQYERGYYIPVTETYDKSQEGNGRSYIIGQEPLMSTFTSPWAALNATERADRFGEFAALLNGMDAVKTDDGSGHATADRAITTLSNYNYTIYVPTNASVKALIESHQLPTWDDVDNLNNCIKGSELSEEDEAYLTAQVKAMTDVINNFVNYHIQDNSVYVEGETHTNDVFESACLDTLTNRFVKLYVNYTQGGELTVTDNVGNVRRVDPTLNNVLTRQYYFNGANLQGNSCTQIYSSSFAVLHQIDAPLVSSPTLFYSPEEYAKAYAIMAANPVSPVKRNTK